jgi:succinate dehydrogenase / fumarate reductase cytochrome b subunit
MSKRNGVGVMDGLKYQGGGPMFAWILHRITGLAILLFVGLHVMASFFTQELGSSWAINLNKIYESSAFQILVVFIVLYHAINGTRIIILDVWPKYLQYQREAIWVQWVIFIPIFGLTAAVIIMHTLTKS